MNPQQPGPPQEPDPNRTVRHRWPQPAAPDQPDTQPPFPAQPPYPSQPQSRPQGQPQPGPHHPGPHHPGQQYPAPQYPGQTNPGQPYPPPPQHQPGAWDEPPGTRRLPYTPDMFQDVAHVEAAPPRKAWWWVVVVGGVALLVAAVAVGAILWVRGSADPPATPKGERKTEQQPAGAPASPTPRRTFPTCSPPAGRRRNPAWSSRSPPRRRATR